MTSRNISKEKRERLISIIKDRINVVDDETKAVLNEIVFELNKNKYGLIWEEHSEEVYDLMQNNIPVFIEDSNRLIYKDKNRPMNYIIEGDNLHALYLLEKTHKGKVDCIYIDPPYNTGAKDWKYNNNYVDSNDSFRHSKWLSMMYKRIVLAKKLLNPKSSVLIVTIDDNEYAHLGCMLEELFQGSKITMISSVINPAGKAKKGGVDFSRTDEYIFFVQIGDCPVLPEVREVVETPIAWESFRRHTLANGRGKHGVGACGPNQFYPFYINDKTREIVDIGEPLPENIDRFSVKQIPGCTAVFPVRDNGIEMNWGAVRETAWALYNKGYLRVGKYSPEKPQQYAINYLTKGTINAIEKGEVVVTKKDERGIIEGFFPVGKPKVPTTNWNKPTHNATSYGTDLINNIFAGLRFDYPKSLYAVADCLKLFLTNKKNATIIDFFAGSGTTMHAVFLMNAEDNGNRKCILVTNNEVSIEEEKRFESQGIRKGSEEWEEKGIARYVTWPRIECVINGVDILGNKLKGSYLGSNIPLSDGFNENVTFYKTGFIPKERDGSVPGNLINYVRELIQLEKHAGPCDKSFRIAVSEDELDCIFKTDLSMCKAIYIPNDVFLTARQKNEVEENGIEIYSIPEYYYSEELREVDEV